MRKQRFRAPYAIARHVVRRERERNNIDTVCKYYDSLCVEARVAAACGKQRQRQRLRCWPICYSTWTTISSANSASPVTWGSHAGGMPQKHSPMLCATLPWIGKTPIHQYNNMLAHTHRHTFNRFNCSCLHECATLRNSCKSLCTLLIIYLKRYLQFFCIHFHNFVFLGTVSACCFACAQTIEPFLCPYKCKNFWRK